MDELISTSNDVNRIYVRRTDFKSSEEFNNYIYNLLKMLASNPSNMIVCYQSLDPNIYIIEVNIMDISLNNKFPMWLTPEEVLVINNIRKSKSKKEDSNDDDLNLGGLA